MIGSAEAARPIDRPPAIRPWLVALALCAATVLIRAQTFGNPLVGYDEQFYLLVGDRMLHGALPYVDIFDRKPIGLFLIYAAIRALGGQGFWQYQLVAAAVVALTAMLIFRAARRIGDDAAALICALLYILWLNFLEGEGGQSELFFDLPMLGAALLTWRAVETRERIVARGNAAMLLAGIALQIKYTTIFEGMFFGMVLVWAQYRRHHRIGALIGPITGWIALALAPTALAMLAYWRLGQLPAFVFANFQSTFGRLPDPLDAQAAGLAATLGILSPLFVCAALAWWSLTAPARARAGFVWLWLAAALIGYLAFKSFLTLHYGIPLLLPLCIAAAPLFAGSGRRRAAGIALAALAALASQVALQRTTFIKGGRDLAQAMAAAARPHHGCIFVYDGYPALYMLTHSCLPTRWPFPGHLDSSNEGSVRAIGIDPQAEMRRILASRPEVIVDDYPVYYLANQANNAMLQAVLRRDYRLVARFKAGSDRYRLVYRLRGAS